MHSGPSNSKGFNPEQTTSAEPVLDLLDSARLGVAVEFCMISWSADYLENGLGMLKVDAAQAVSLFLAAMIVGRLAGSRLVQHFSTHKVVLISIVVASLGFLVYWKAGSILPGLGGLFVTGLGVASLYPLILSLAIGAANGQTVQASARATLASGTAILTLPLMLGVWRIRWGSGCLWSGGRFAVQCFPDHLARRKALPSPTDRGERGGWS